MTLEQIEEAVAQHGSIRKAAKALGRSESGLRGRLQRARRTPQAPTAMVERKGDDLVVTAPAGSSVRELIEGQGINADEWAIVGQSFKQWDVAVAGGGTQEMRSISVNLRPLSLIETCLRPAALPPLEGLLTPRPFTPTTADLGVLTGCWQYPYQDPEFEHLFERFLADVRPAFGIDHGDGMDLASVSRHADDPATDDPAQASVDGYGLALYRRRKVSPDTAWRVLFGNHDIRLLTEALQRAERLAGVRPARWPGEGEEKPLLSIERALRTDELGVEVVAPPFGSAKYAAAECVISPHYIAVHGTKTDSNSAARATVQQYGCSVSMAHTHRQRLFSVRLQRGALPAVDATGVEVGCGMEIGGRGAVYATRPDWSNGAMTVTLDDDGQPFFEPIRYRNGVLSWRDYRWS